MLKKDIEALQGKLNSLISNKADYSLIYDISIQLDDLIVNYYRKCLIR